VPLSANSVSRLYWLWPALLAAMIFAASSRSHLAGPAVEGSDKVVHFCVYGLLATLTLRALLFSGDRLARHAVWLSIALVSLYGISDEWHQSFTPGRSVEVADWIADTSGGLLAVALYTFWTGYRRLLEKPLRFRKKPRLETAPPAPAVSPS
jgi:VanZ family protein